MLVRRDVMVPVLAHGEVAPDFTVQVVGTLRQALADPERQATVTPLWPPAPDAVAA